MHSGLHANMHTTQVMAAIKGHLQLNVILIANCACNSVHVQHTACLLECCATMLAPSCKFSLEQDSLLQQAYVLHCVALIVLCMPSTWTSASYLDRNNHDRALRASAVYSCCTKAWAHKPTFKTNATPLRHRQWPPVALVAGSVQDRQVKHRTAPVDAVQHGASRT